MSSEYNSKTVFDASIITYMSKLAAHRWFKDFKAVPDEKGITISGISPIAGDICGIEFQIILLYYGSGKYVVVDFSVQAIQDIGGFCDYESIPIIDPDELFAFYGKQIQGDSVHFNSWDLWTAADFADLLKSYDDYARDTGGRRIFYK